MRVCVCVTECVTCVSYCHLQDCGGDYKMYEESCIESVLQGMSTYVIMLCTVCIKHLNLEV